MTLCHLVESTEIIYALPVPHTQILGYVVTSSKIVDEAHDFKVKLMHQSKFNLDC